jgi:hypothetical protein
MSKGFFNLTGTKTGLNIGAYGGYYILPNFSASFEPMYSQIGANDISKDILYYPSIDKVFIGNIKEMDLFFDFILRKQENIPLMIYWIENNFNLSRFLNREDISGLRI